MIASKNIITLFSDPNFVSSQQVWLMLNIAEIEYTQVNYSIFDLEFLHMQANEDIPKGLWPPLLHNGAKIYEGAKNCLEYLKDTPQVKALRAPDWLDGRAQKMASLALDLEDHLLMVEGEFFYRPYMKPYRKHIDSFVQNIKDKTKSNLLENIISGQLSNHALGISLDTIHAALNKIDEHLKHQITINGDEYGYADIIWIPLIRRLLFLHWPVKELYSEIMPWYQHSLTYYTKVKDLEFYENLQSKKGMHKLWHYLNWIGGQNLPASLKLRGIISK